MTETSHATRLNAAEIIDIITSEQTERFKHIKELLHLLPHINGWKDGKVTYSTPSPDDKHKHTKLLESWRAPEEAYRMRLSSFGYILPDKDFYSPHPLAPVALQALRNNDPDIFKSDPHALIIAEAILLRTLDKRHNFVARM